MELANDGQIERRTHDYKRHGTTSLFAALGVKACTVVGSHRANEFRKFIDEVEKNVPTDLDVHIVMDNYGTHKTKLIRNWFAKRRLLLEEQGGMCISRLPPRHGSIRSEYHWRSRRVACRAKASHGSRLQAA